MVLNGSGEPLHGRTIFWASEDPTVATVSSSGVVTALAGGATRIAASSEGVWAIAEVEVSPRRVHSVSVVPPAAETMIGGTVHLRAIAYDSTGAELTGRMFTWSRSNDNVSLQEGATPDSQQVRGERFGSAQVTATAEGKSGSATITVGVLPADGALRVETASRHSWVRRTRPPGRDPLRLQPDRVVAWVRGN